MSCPQRLCSHVVALLTAWVLFMAGALVDGRAAAQKYWRTRTAWLHLRAERARAGGLVRARSWRTCNMTYMTTRKAPIFIASDALKLIYVLMSKSGSSTVRELLRSNKAVKKPNWNYTMFTVVRDPLERSVSGFYETKDVNRFKLSTKEALEAFDTATKGLVRGQGGHAHGQRSVPLPAEHPYDFVCTIATFATDWAQLGELQKRRFGIVDWSQVVPDARNHKKKYGSVLNVSTLSANLSQRICDVYRDDYCCFRLPLPTACRVDCVRGLPVDPPQARAGGHEDPRTLGSRGWP